MLVSCVRLFVTPWTVVSQASLSMQFSRQEYWSGLPFPIPEDLPETWVKPSSPGSRAVAGGFFTTEPPGKPIQGLSISIVSGFFPQLNFVKAPFPIPTTGKRIGFEGRQTWV